MNFIQKSCSSKFQMCPQEIRNHGNNGIFNDMASEVFFADGALYPINQTICSHTLNSFCKSCRKQQTAKRFSSI